MMTGTSRQTIQWQDNEHLLLSQLMSLAGGVADNGASPATWIEPDLHTRRLAAPQAVNGCFVYTDKSDFESSFGQRANENSGLSTLPKLCYVDLFRVQEAYVEDPSCASSTPTQVFPPTPDADVVGWFGSLPILESAMCTSMLSGAKFTQPEHGVLNGRPATMFVFSDLAVRGAGAFILRYRMLETRPHYPPPFLLGTVALECFGEPFTVSSPSEEDYSGNESALPADAPLNSDRVPSRL